MSSIQHVPIKNRVSSTGSFFYKIRIQYGLLGNNCTKYVLIILNYSDPLDPSAGKVARTQNLIITTIYLKK